MPDTVHNRSCTWKALAEDEKNDTETASQDASATEVKIKKSGGCGDDVKLPLGEFLDFMIHERLSC